MIWRVSEDLPDTYGVVGRKVETADGGKFYTVDEVMPRPDGVSVRRGQIAIPESQLVAFKQKAGQPAPVAAPGAAAAVDVRYRAGWPARGGHAAQPAPPAEGAVPATVSGKLMGLDDYVKSTATLYDETAQGGT